MDPKSKVAVEQKLWSAFSGYENELGFLDAWLAIQRQMIAGAERAWLFTERPDASFGLIALHPDPTKIAPEADDWSVEQPLAEVVSDVLARGEGVAEPAPPGRDGVDRRWLVALPLSADGRVVCAIVVGVETDDPGLVASAMRQLQWGGGWVLDWLRRQRMEAQATAQKAAKAIREASDASARIRSAPQPSQPSGAAPAGATASDAYALRMVAGVLEAPRFKEAAAAFTTHLADAFQLERASVGLRRGGRTRIASMSHAAFAKDRMDELRRIEAAMDEALDQDAAIALPDQAEAPGLVVRAHQALGRDSGAVAVASVPIAGPSGQGALTLERDAPFTPEELEAFDAAARLGGVALLEKRDNDRSIFAKIGRAVRDQLVWLLGPKKPVLKAGLLATALGFAAISVIPAEFDLRAPVVLEAAQMRVVAAPLDGFLLTATARAGDTVKEGQLLAQFDTADLVLQRSGLIADRNQASVRLEEATAAYKLSEAKVHKAKVAQIEAELALIDARIARARITAPFDGLLVSGDLSQSIGEPMKAGRELFEIAPAGAYVLAVNVDERDMAYVSEGLTGRFVLAAAPSDNRAFTVKRVTPILQAEEGRNYYRVEAELAAAQPGDRPGLEGRARIAAGEASILWLWTRNLTAWVKLQLWALLP